MDMTTTVQGDTWDTIATRVYGDERKAQASENTPALLSNLNPPAEDTLSEALDHADEQAKQFNARVNAGIMAWLREQGIDPDNPPEQWPE